MLKGTRQISHLHRLVRLQSLLRLLYLSECALFTPTRTEEAQARLCVSLLIRIISESNSLIAAIETTSNKRERIQDSTDSPKIDRVIPPSLQRSLNKSLASIPPVHLRTLASVLLQVAGMVEASQLAKPAPVHPALNSPIEVRDDEEEEDSDWWQ